MCCSPSEGRRIQDCWGTYSRTTRVGVIKPLVTLYSAVRDLIMASFDHEFVVGSDCVVGSDWDDSKANGPVRIYKASECS